MTLTNKTYDFLMKLAQVVLPGVGTLYFALAPIWSLPHAQEIIGSITAVDAFLGVVLAALKSSYKPATDGRLVIDKSDPAKDIYRLELTSALSEIDGKNAITLAVTPPDKKL